jgi:hypothetical protein
VVCVNMHGRLSVSHGADCGVADLPSFRQVSGNGSCAAELTEDGEMS